jgi:hypothetical protein
VAGNGKGRSLERPFLFLTLYYQNTKRSVETCQISLGILACKWRVMTACYFRAEAGLLTKKEEKAKRGEIRDYGLGDRGLFAAMSMEKAERGAKEGFRYFRCAGHSVPRVSLSGIVRGYTEHPMDAIGSARKIGRRILALYALWSSIGFAVLSAVVIYEAVTGRLGMWALPLLPLYALLFWSVYRVTAKRRVNPRNQG